MNKLDRAINLLTMGIPKEKLGYLGEEIVKQAFKEIQVKGGDQK